MIAGARAKGVIDTKTFGLFISMRLRCIFLFFFEAPCLKGAFFFFFFF